MAAVKEFLRGHLLRQIWQKAAERQDDCPESAPDLQAYKQLRADVQKDSKHRHLYFLS